MDKIVLMVAFHYPPARASGTQRTLSFSRYLSDFGWNATVISAHPRAYEAKDQGQMDQIPPGVDVWRPFALDAARHLAIAGRYSRLTAWPDRWASWLLGALPTGLFLLHRLRPKVVWSTYPIATSLLIGFALSRMGQLPWVVDLRDPMVMGRHPLDPAIRKLFILMERWIVHRCHRVVVTTPGLMTLLMERYPELPREKWSVIPNGYDEEVFQSLDHECQEKSSRKKGEKLKKITLLHSGTLYTGKDERNPTVFLDALVELREKTFLEDFSASSPDRLGVRVRFRATDHDEEISAMIRARNLETMVQILPPLPYAEGLREMLLVDGLLLFQGEAFDRLIPAKLFEYLRSKIPVLALVGEHGDSRKIMEACGSHYWSPLNHRETMVARLKEFLQVVAAGEAKEPDQAVVRTFSRREGAKSLASLLDELIKEAG